MTELQQLVINEISTPDLLRELAERRDSSIELERVVLVNTTTPNLLREMTKRMLESAHDIIDVTNVTKLTSSHLRDHLMAAAVDAFDHMVPDIIVDGGCTNAQPNSTGITFYVQHFIDEIFKAHPNLSVIEIPAIAMQL